MNTPSEFETSVRSHLKRAAKQVPKQELDHFPPLLAYRCLAAASDVLADASWAVMHTSRSRATELITMPRHSFGPRPVSLLSPTVRTIYAALVRRLRPGLEEPSRAHGNWAEHHSFGREGTHSYVVDLDFAACYEFIDHRDLADELTMRSMDPTTVASLRDVLDAISPRSRGLPQMLQPSDRLADTYLARIDRHLGRLGYELHRYVDDFRVVADSWNEANQIIEDAADVARELGLTLSSEKTTIRKRETVTESELAAETFLDSYLKQAGLEGGADGRRDPYDPELEGDEQVDAGVADVYIDVVNDWHERFQSGPGRPELPSGMAANLVTALRGSTNASIRLPDDLLSDLVFDDPLRLEAVCRYLEDRSVARRYDGDPEDGEYWESLTRLTEMGRQSPWAKVWLLNSAASLLSEADANPSQAVLDWVDDQVNSSLETIRSEAAWVIARQEKLDSDLVKDIYAAATDVTAPAIAAAIGLQGNLPKTIVDAVRYDSPLNEAAYTWAAN